MPSLLEHLPNFKRRLRWVFEHRPELAKLVSHWLDGSSEERHLLSLLRGHRMKCLLQRMLDESEFLSDYGIRSMSKYHERHPYEIGARQATSSASAMFRAIPTRASSAATQTGAARSGCRSTI